MSEHIAQAEGQGRLSVNGHQSPVSYHITARQDEPEGAIDVRVELQAPRDWLMQRDFGREAVLLRSNGEQTTLRSTEAVGVDSPISVTLSGKLRACTTESEMFRRVPEFHAAH